jgi:peptidoglycan hydrolase CwlO-like protein
MFKVRLNKRNMTGNTRMAKTKQKAAGLKKITLLSILGLATVLTMGSVVVPPARADSVDDQIRQLQQENANNKNAVAQLQNEAVSYKDAITRLQSQINILQGQIDNNLAKQAELQATIEANQRELDRQRSILGENIHVMYVEGHISTIEMLATSKNLSDFVDKEEYRTAIKNKIQDTLKRINDLQNQLKEQKLQIERLLTEQQTQQAQLTGARAEQSRMLSYNQSQQGAYNQKTKANQARIDRLIAEQARAIDMSASYYFLRFPGEVTNDAFGDDYPYANAGFSMSTAPGCNDNDGPDRWGYCTRQCVSWTAWAVERSGRHAPRYYGNAKNWVAAARRDGVYITTTSPQAGDVAISTAGTWGHAMYVEKVDGSRVYVSQYNRHLDGRYSTEWRSFE